MDSDFVLLEDEFLRDGLQNEKRLFSVEEKLAFVHQLLDAGVRRIQLGSFVHPQRVPQMANTDELCAQVPAREGVTYSALVLNRQGLERALAAKLAHLSISISASETHSLKNTGRGSDQARQAMARVIEKAVGEGVMVRAGIQSALGCAYEGHIDPQRVVGIAREFAALGAQEINIADTAGLANPMQLKALCMQLQQALGDQVALSLHLHDTRGLGIANFIAGIEAGVRIFDTALGGLGGCPFVPDATGNIATEDAAFTCEEIGYSTGIHWQALRAPVAIAEAMLERTLPARMSHVPPPPWRLST